jgi:hypothetical protein
MAKKDDREKFALQIPLDASGIEGFKPEKAVKVLIQDSKGALHSQMVRLNEKGQGIATFNFEEHPGALRIVLGPEDASDQELLGLQTINLDVSSRQWQTKNELKLPTIRVSAYYWWWWWRWCQTFTIRGRIVCPDGSPVPGAKVCAYDVDWWWLWSSTQLVGCDTTDINGTFEIKFRWCCGWWPWWWWKYRVWNLDPILTDRVSAVLQHAPNVRLSPITTNQPSLTVFKELLAEQGLAVNRPLVARDVGRLEQVRGQLLQKLPVAPELERLRVWPWFPWWPWWDCAPDIIFKVTQDCMEPGTLIIDEGIGDTRWDIPNALDVVLLANEKACCRTGCGDEPCPECFVIDRVCGDPINEIGGNLAAPATPAGYLRPGAVLPGVADYNGDRPYAGIIPIEKNSGDLPGVDYYELEFFSGGVWQPLPTGAAVDYRRRWMLFPAVTVGDESFPFVTMLDGAAVPHSVVETREHFETTHYLDWWPIGYRIWIQNETLVVPLNTSKFADGTYHFRVVGWQLGAGGQLVNRQVLDVCGTDQDNDLVLTFDNQIVDPLTHDLSHNCGLGVHACTPEPDTHIIEVRINGVKVDPCDTVDAKEGTLEIDFLAHDPDGHLAAYSLQATYGLSLAVNLLNRAGSVVTPIVPGTPTGWAAVPPNNNNGTYGVALAQGAVAPHWHGGMYRLTVPVSQAFPEPCCYQLELRAWKRTVVGSQSGIVFSCYNGYAHNNLTEYTLGVGVCP